MGNKKLIISHIKAGFGNQLFQFATGYALAKRIGADFKLDLSHYVDDRKSQFKLSYLKLDYQIASQEEIMELSNVEPAPFFFKVLHKIGISSKYRKKSHINERFGFNPDPRILNQNSSCYITGWCTSMGYLENDKKSLCELFSMRESFSKEASIYRDKIHKTESVALHIRRGDYLKLEHFFKILDLSYYEEARDLICTKITKPHFFVFSNDLAWVKLQFHDWKENVTFVDLYATGDYAGPADIEEFFLMKE
jgi:hypothetical protein